MILLLAYLPTTNAFSLYAHPRVDDPLLDFFCSGHQFLSELLDALKPAAWTLQDSLGDEHVCIAHKLLVLPHLGVQQVWKDLSRDHFLLLARERCDRSFGLGVQFPVSLFGVQAKAASFFVAVATRCNLLRVVC